MLSCFLCRARMACVKERKLSELEDVLAFSLIVKSFCLPLKENPEWQVSLVWQRLPACWGRLLKMKRSGRKITSGTCNETQYSLSVACAVFSKEETRESGYWAKEKGLGRLFSSSQASIRSCSWENLFVALKSMCEELREVLGWVLGGWHRLDPIQAFQRSLQCLQEKLFHLRNEG